MCVYILVNEWCFFILRNYIYKNKYEYEHIYTHIYICKYESEFGA